MQRGECITSADNREGVCLPKSTCLATGGIVAGTCGFLSFCCIYQGTCRSTLSANESYFVSPNYPNLLTERLDPSVCIFTLQRSLFQKDSICQLRLDFNEFNLAPPINGNCGGQTDSFVISGANNFASSGLPATGICGDLTGQHMYIDVDPQNVFQPLLLVVTIANEERYNRKWSIKVQQISCHSAFKAPSGCLQYFSSEQDVIESFNFRGMPISRQSLPNSGAISPSNEVNYFNNLNYGICVAQKSNNCAIQWEAVTFDFGGLEAGLASVDSSACISTTAVSGQSDEGDYIIIPAASNDGIGGLRSLFCGQRLNSIARSSVNSPIIYLWPWLSPGGQIPGSGIIPGTNLHTHAVKDCPTTDGNRTGICVRTSRECIARGGRVLGNCYPQTQLGSQRPSQVGIGSTLNFFPGFPVGVCCFYQVICGGTIAQNGTYFRNPNAPQEYNDPGACSVTIRKLSYDICQIRLDFLIMALAQPTNGNCDIDRFVINGQSQNDILPPICGINSGQHMYIDVSKNRGEITLNVLTTGQRSRRFDIRVTQIECLSPYRAPENCLQYYFDLVGNIRSLNFDLYNNGYTYFNNLDYTMCFKKHAGFCTITYSAPRETDNQVDPNRPITPGQSPLTANYFDIQADSKVGEAAGAGIFECPSDFLLLAGIRYCGGKLNGNIFQQTNPTTNSEIFDNSTGPLYARFVSDSSQVKNGFYINYRLNPCFIAGG
ncbi:uncharacterized protein B4U79_13640 [Dinothrombium tinctorium]|uniref:CUB domain-containing protein n=1 Tax=Dinothrombium tinctorium TaxID=1965070 RepID=A0A443RJV1_9ACAR|nr:uncharacterized protein B4U79_13640 [Dinothrombium tinctorium]